MIAAGWHIQRPVGRAEVAASPGPCDLMLLVAFCHNVLMAGAIVAACEGKDKGPYSFPLLVA